MQRYVEALPQDHRQKTTENLTPKQNEKLSDLLHCDLNTVRAYFLKESFDVFWNYRRSYWAGWFLKQWCARAMRSRLEPMK